MDQYIGKLLDNRYEILERIGVGGMAMVYKARCHRLNRLVAIKILRDDLAQDAEFRRRFHDESKAVAQLSHANIVAVHDVSRSSDSEYIVMELIDGITLKQYIKKNGNILNWRESLHFIIQITKALGHAHSRGIIHRDIKPHNIMVLKDGSVKVADFGIARLAGGSNSTLTQEALGSVHYISPEQARGSHIDQRSDLYSTGVVLYEMTTGRLPFEGDSAVSVAIQHINSIPLSPREINPSLPEALETITMRAMAPNPDNRYSSAEEMLESLEEFRKNPEVNFDYKPPVEENLEPGAVTQVIPPPRPPKEPTPQDKRSPQAKRNPPQNREDYREPVRRRR
ncbi:MAG: protein kinase, partial [Eubacteriales bacterium]